MQIRGIANISAAYHKSQYLTTEGGSTSLSTSRNNYSTIANDVIARAKYSMHERGDTTEFTSAPWDYSNVKTEDSKYLEVSKRKSSRFVYCGFNDMFITNDSSTLLPVSKPIYIDRDDPMAAYKTDNKYDGFGGNISYNNYVNELSSLDKDKGVIDVNYKANSHLLLNLKNSKYLPMWSAGKDNSTNYKRLKVPYYRDTSSTEHEFDTHYLDSTTLLGLTDSEMLNRNHVTDPRLGGGYSYLFIVDILRDIPQELRYGGNSLEAIQSNLWIPAGDAVGIQDTTTLEATYGDTYIQRYDTLRVSNNNSEIQETSEVLSVLLESYVNLDGRYDTKRGSADVSSYNTSNYAHVNDVYSQKNNLFTSNIIDYNKFKSDRFNYSVLISEPKKPNEFIDSWTSL